MMDMLRLSFRQLFPAALFLLAALLTSLPAFAAPPPPPPQTFAQCNDNLGISLTDEQYRIQFASVVVNCLKGTVVTTTVTFLEELSRFMAPLVAILSTIAIIIYGFRIAGGEPNLRSKAAGFMLRMVLVGFFSYNLGNIGIKTFDIMDEMVCLVTATGAGDCYPWNFLDSIMGKIMGFGTNIFLFNGLMGLISAALFSSTMGILLFFVGAVAIFDIIFLILRVIFTYLSAVLAVAFMIIISPLIIPWALFMSTERFFRQWLDILISAMLVPMMLFAFLTAFMGIYDRQADKIISILGGKDAQGVAHFEAYWRMNEPKFSWIMPADPNAYNDMAANIAGGDKKNVGVPSVQTFVNPFARRAMENNLLQTPGVDFGEVTVQIIQQIVYIMISMFIFTTLLKSLISKVPEVAQSIGSSRVGIEYQAVSIEGGVKNAVSQMRDLASGRTAGQGASAGRSRRSLT